MTSVAPTAFAPTAISHLLTAQQSVGSDNNESGSLFNFWSVTIIKISFTEIVPLAKRSKRHATVRKIKTIRTHHNTEILRNFICCSVK
jgi:hypothetical protein